MRGAARAGRGQASGRAVGQRRAAQLRREGADLGARGRRRVSDRWRHVPSTPRTGLGSTEVQGECRSVGSRSPVRDAREKPSSPLHVAHVIIAESFRQMRFFRGGADHEQGHSEPTSECNEPIGRCKRIGRNGQGGRDVEGMTNEAVRAARHQRVVLSGHHGIREIGPQAPQRPDQQGSGHNSHAHTNPPEPQRQRHRRPGHPGGTGNERQEPRSCSPSRSAGA